MITAHQCRQAAASLKVAGDTDTADLLFAASELCETFGQLTVEHEALLVDRNQVLAQMSALTAQRDQALAVITAARAVLEETEP